MHHSQVRGIDVQRSIGHLQSPYRLCSIDVVSLLDLFEHRLIGRAVWMLFEPAFCPDFSLGIKVALQLGIGEHNRSNIPAFDDHIQVFGNSSELLVHMLAQWRIRGDFRNIPVNLIGMELVLHILSSHTDTPIPHSKDMLFRSLKDGRKIHRIFAQLNMQVGIRTVKRAGIQIIKITGPSNHFCNGALAHPRWSIDCNYHETFLFFTGSVSPLSMASISEGNTARY
ncbi:hypothetical protein SDC9_95426 [bioreactor metagenome]|uniref:Uncharacterized protein n=1 Tax=bioreactor metagenome TaxID=1076179 RepID=A0A645A6A1_9ZZZZ